MFNLHVISRTLSDRLILLFLLCLLLEVGRLVFCRSIFVLMPIAKGLPTRSFQL